jgi:hypothetical protein
VSSAEHVTHEVEILLHGLVLFSQFGGVILTLS